MENLIQQRKSIIESWSTTWNINKTSKAGPMGFRFIYPFLAIIIVPGFVLINYAIVNELFSITERFTWNDVAFFTAMIISLVFNAHHRLHLKSYLHGHYRELDSNSFSLTEESNQKLKRLIDYDKRPIHWSSMILGILIMLIAIIAHLGDYFTVWQYTWPAFLVYEILYFFNARQYLKEFQSMKASMNN